jgi:hypothetical protein
LYFPDGEDPDSFAKKTSHDDLVAYLEDNKRFHPVQSVTTDE